MKKYYKKAIKRNSDEAMVELADFYGFDEYTIHNYDKMKKYYLMAIDKDNVYAMRKLAIYYQKTNVNCKLMKKYYKMAIEKDDKYSITTLKIWYEKNQKPISILKLYMRYPNTISRNKIIEYINIMIRDKQFSKLLVEYGLGKDMLFLNNKMLLLCEKNSMIK